MLIVLPLLPDLRLGHPFVSVAVIVICIVVYQFQAESRRMVESSARSFCTQLKEEAPDDRLARNLKACSETLADLHQVHDIRSERRTVSEEVWAHYQRFRATAPPSVDSALLYRPDRFNPLRSVTSVFAHADWAHILFNLIFFLAFAPAVELVIGCAWRFAALIVGLALVTNWAYALFTAFGHPPLPSLGLSGVVMGVIGLSLYLMPRARIRTLVWLLVWGWVYYIPAGILATWFIGWDTFAMLRYGNSGGVNVVAHVAGGFAGALLGYALLRERKASIAHELAEEIEYRRAQRTDLVLGSSYRFGMERLRGEQIQRTHEKAFDAALDHAYALTMSDKSREALVVLLDALERHGQTPELLERVLTLMKDWPPSRLAGCFVRHYIDRLAADRRTAQALQLYGWALERDPDFRLADPLTVLPLAEAALTSGRWTLAHSLVCDAERRYGPHLDLAKARLIEAELLFDHLGQPARARALLEPFEADGGFTGRPDLAARARALLAAS